MMCTCMLMLVCYVLSRLFVITDNYVHCVVWVINTSGSIYGLFPSLCGLFTMSFYKIHFQSALQCQGFNH